MFALFPQLCYVRYAFLSWLARYPCHSGHVNQPQKFSFIANPGWIQNPITWGDNGRRRTFETCLDRLPIQNQNVAVQDCATAKETGVRWDSARQVRCFFFFSFTRPRASPFCRRRFHFRYQYQRLKTTGARGARNPQLRKS